MGIFTDYYLKTIEDVVEWHMSGGKVDGVSFDSYQVVEQLQNMSALIEAEGVPAGVVYALRAIKRAATDEEIARTMEPDGHVDADTVYLGNTPLYNLSGEKCYAKLEVFWYGGYTAVVGSLTADEVYAGPEDIWVFGNHVKLEEMVAEYLELCGLITLT